MFAAGIAYSGVPAGCFYTGTINGWNSTCSQGQSIHTQQEWASTVLNMYPGYTGKRPKMQIYHGSADTTLHAQNFQETIKQWTGVFGYSTTPIQTLQGNPSSAYTKYIYGENLEGIYGQGVGHSVPVMGAEDMKFFGFTVSCARGRGERGCHWLTGWTGQQQRRWEHDQHNSSCDDDHDDDLGAAKFKYWHRWRAAKMGTVWRHRVDGPNSGLLPAVHVLPELG
jgi:hypothetical protein